MIFGDVHLNYNVFPMMLIMAVHIKLPYVNKSEKGYIGTCIGTIKIKSIA